MEIPYSSLNLATLYTRERSGRWQGQQAGDTIAVADWPVPHRHPLLPLQLSASDPSSYLLRIENPHSFSAPLRFVTERAVNQREQRASLALGIYFGLAGLTAAVSLLSGASLRDSSYWLYVVSVLLMGLSQAAMTGIAGLHLWPHQPWWNDLSPLILPVLAVGAVLRFFSEVVSLPERSPALHRVISGLSILSLVTAGGIT